MVSFSRERYLDDTGDCVLLIKSSTGMSMALCDYGGRYSEISTVHFGLKFAHQLLKWRSMDPY